MTLRMYDLAGADPARRFSPFCWRSKLALAHKGLAVETLPWRFTETDALQPSEQGRVPVLVDGGTWIADSWAIALHLEEKYPDRPSLFGGAASIPVTRFVNSWMDTVIHPLLARLVVHDIHEHIADKDKAYFRTSREQRFGKTLEATQAEREQVVAQFRQALQPLRATFTAAQPYIGGARPMYADYIAAGGFLWVRAVSRFQLLSADDPLDVWRQRMLDACGGLARRSPGYGD